MDWTPRGPVVVVGTLDTKGEEILFLKQLLCAQRLEVLVVDVGVLDAPAFAADVTREEIAACADTRIEELVRECDRGNAIRAMERGFATWLRARRDSIGGILAIGGSAGTVIATAGMRELPIGVPKLMVSTLASGDTRPYVGTVDLGMMFPVGDFAGLNRLTRRVLANAANAMAGMCSLPAPVPAGGEDRAVVGATMFGVTTPCVNRARELLVAGGFEVLVFHATGTGGQAMERLIRDGYIQGVLDLTTTELADELVGGVLSAGPHRLEAAGERGIPQVISVGALDMVNFGPPGTVPPEFRTRTFYQHNPAVTLMRTTVEENARLGRILAEKANAARGPASILLPLRGVSAIDAEGQPFHDPAADTALLDAIRCHARVKIIDVDAHINDPKFAGRAAEELLGMLTQTGAAGRREDVSA